MNCRFADLRHKEVISACDGTRLGFVDDIIVDTKNMRVAGLIDWEYSGWGTLETEFNNCTAFSSHMRASGIMDIIRREYAKMNPTENLEVAQ